MITYRIYSRPSGRPKARPKLEATHYNEKAAAETAGRLALTGLWVRITQAEGEDPSRWD